MSPPIRVLLADHHPIFRDGLRAALAREPDLAVAEEATTGAEALRLAADPGADVLVLDPGGVGPGTDPARCPAPRGAPHPPGAGALGAGGRDRRAGTARPRHRGLPPEGRATAGGTWLSRAVAARVALRGDEGALVVEPLTRRERQLLRLVAQGWDNARIAATLGLAEQTVRNYLSRIYVKLGVRSRAEAIVWAREHNLGGRP